MGYSLETGGGEKLYRIKARKLKAPKFRVGEFDLRSAAEVAVTLLIV